MRLLLAHACAVLALAAGGCMSSDHDALAARPEGRDAAAGSGGSGTDGSVAPDATVDEPSVLPEGAVAEAADDAEETGVIPDGPSVLTLVNGLADAPAVRVCFHAGSGTSFAPLPVAPLPDSPAGLPFATALVRFELPGGVELASQDVLPVVYSGELQDLGACDTLQPPPPGVLATAMQVIPAGTLVAGRSVLAVLAGCVGGPGHDSYAVDFVCGKGYSLSTPNAKMLVATMARAPVAERIGLQAFGGSLAATTLGLRHATAEQFIADIAYDVNPGTIAPKPPSVDLTEQTLGADPAEGKLSVYQKYSSSPAATVTLGEALERGGLQPADFVNGRNFTAIWVGAREAVAPGPWWKPFTLLVVRSDPEP
jgi:hypothetical protein